MKIHNILNAGRVAALSLLVGIVFFNTSAAAVAQDADAIDETEDTFGIVIAPRIAPDESDDYRTIFRSISFSRSEFDANPSYRHEATMELLTGDPRPPNTHVHVPAPAPAPPIDYYPLNLPVMRHYFDMSRGPYSRYQRLFGYEGGYRPQFYRY